jgi:hypothetical protein
LLLGCHTTGLDEASPKILFLKEEETFQIFVGMFCLFIDDLALKQMGA